MLVGKTICVYTRDSEGRQVESQRHIIRIVPKSSPRLYEFKDMTTGQVGQALKSKYDELFKCKLKREIKPQFYKGENKSSKVRITENLTVKENKFAKSQRHGK